MKEAEFAKLMKSTFEQQIKENSMSLETEARIRENFQKSLEEFNKQQSVAVEEHNATAHAQDDYMHLHEADDILSDNSPAQCAAEQFGPDVNNLDVTNDMDIDDVGDDGR